MGLTVTILEVVHRNGNVYVRFKSSIGKGWARWHTSRDLDPSVGTTYSAEPELEEPITAMKAVPPQNDAFTDMDTHMVLVGTVQQILDDGMRVLSVGEGSLVIDQRGDFGLATCVAITAKGLELFDEGI